MLGAIYDIRFGSGDEEEALWKGLDSKLSWLEKAPVQRRFDLFRRCHYPHIFENVYSGVGDVVFRHWRDIREHVLMQWYIGLVLAPLRAIPLPDWRGICQKVPPKVLTNENRT